MLIPMLMKRCCLLAAAALIAAFAAVACGKDSDVRVNDSTMAFVTGASRLYTDAGLTYEIVSAPDGFSFDFGTRVYAVCEVGECLDASGKIYEARVLKCSVPLTDAPVDITGGKNPDFNMDDWADAISVNQAWISGGYLNIYCSWIGHRGSSVEQKTALVCRGNEDGVVSFSLVHDSSGEGFYASGETADLVTINKMATFPIQDLLPSGDVTVKLSWVWHKSDGQYIYPQTEPHEISYSFAVSAAASAEPSTNATISPLTTLQPWFPVTATTLPSTAGTMSSMP